MKQTQLFDEHTALGAKMVPFAGWNMPIQYNSVKEEIIAVRNDVGVFDVSHMGEFFVEGRDAVKFVDYLLTCDFAGVEIKKAVYSPLCNDQGKMLDDLIAYKLSDEKILICVNAGNIEQDFKWFESHKNNFDCTLINKSEDMSLLAVQGPNTFKVLKEYFKDELGDIDYYSVANFGEFIIARTGYTGEDGFEVFSSHDQIKKLWKFLIDKGVRPCGLGARDVLRLEVCFPLYGHELNQDLTPLDCGMKWTVKMNKEDFICKSALENYEPKFRILKLQLDKGIPREGYLVELEDETPLGEITSGTMSPTIGKGIALARIQKNKYKKGDKVFIIIRNKKYEAQVVTKPFVTGGHK
jgi:aminomethyltransferase